MLLLRYDPKYAMRNNFNNGSDNVEDSNKNLIQSYPSKFSTFGMISNDQ